MPPSNDYDKLKEMYRREGQAEQDRKFRAMTGMPETPEAPAAPPAPGPMEGLEPSPIMQASVNQDRAALQSKLKRWQAAHQALETAAAKYGLPLPADPREHDSKYPTTYNNPEGAHHELHLGSGIEGYEDRYGADYARHLPPELRRRLLDTQVAFADLFMLAREQSDPGFRERIWEQKQ